jgi:hypothetical protein
MSELGTTERKVCPTDCKHVLRKRGYVNAHCTKFDTMIEAMVGGQTFCRLGKCIEEEVS